MGDLRALDPRLPGFIAAETNRQRPLASKNVGRRINVEPHMRHLYLSVPREIRDVDEVVRRWIPPENGGVDEQADLPASLLPAT